MNTANINEIETAAKANPDMVMPKDEKAAMKAEAKAKAKVLTTVPANPLKSTNIVDHLLNGSVICPADVSSHGLKKDFWRKLVEGFGCLYTSPLKPAAQIVLVTPKDNSPKFERACKQGMNCVEYPIAVKDLMESTNEKVVEFLAHNEEWQAMLKREEEAKNNIAKMMARKIEMAERVAQRAAERAAKLKAESVMEVPVKDIAVPKEAQKVAENPQPELNFQIIEEFDTLEDVSANQ